MGLSKMDAPKGTFIAYATSPDSVAADGTDRNSPYTKHLIEALKVKDIPIELAFKQVGKAVNRETAGQQTPWTSSSLLDDFYFYPSSLTSSLVKPSEGGKTDTEQEVAKLREAERVAALERERLEKAKREHEQEIARLREAERTAALEKERLERERREQEREQELARLREAQRVAALQRERLEREKQELLARVSAPRTVSVPPSKYKEKAERIGALVATRGYAAEELEMYKDAETVRWFRRAGEQGDAVAQVCLGRMFALGLEVPKDQREALKWFKKAADQGNSRAQNNIGLIYRDGLGVPKDYAEAVKWFKKSAEQGQASAQGNLGWMYARGYGMSKDRTEAINWYRKAADQGNEWAKKQLRNLGATSSR